MSPNDILWTSDDFFTSDLVMFLKFLRVFLKALGFASNHMLHIFILGILFFSYKLGSVS